MFFLLIPLCHADWYLTSEQADIDLQISGSFDIQQESSASSLQHVLVNLTWLPLDSSRQKVKSLSTSPEAQLSDESVVYKWESPSYRSHNFALNSRVTLTSDFQKINKKVRFPIASVPQEYLAYTRPSETIDSDHEGIVRLANSLAEGEDDLAVVVHKIAVWTNQNIDYNLSTLTASVSKPASWVFENRRGVCDELTNLFIAMLRSLGIPAKFISGVAYTESELFPERWGPHGWAEVYYPGVGWVSYDVTYGEMGYIDMGHIKLNEMVDAQSSTVKYSWLGRNVNVKTSQIDIDAQLVEFDGIHDEGVRVDLEVEKNEVGFDSFNAVRATVKNDNEYYISQGLYLSQTQGVEIHGPLSQFVLLGPSEQKHVHWIVSIGELDPGYRYTFPVSVRTLSNKTTRTEFYSRSSEVQFSKEDIELLLSAYENSAKKNYKGKLDVECLAEKREFYLSEKNSVQCSLQNDGNVFFESLQVCLKEECKEIALEISKTKEVFFDLEEQEEGKKEEIVSVKGEGASAISTVEYVALDEPSITIINITHPEQVEFENSFVSSFTLKKESFSNPVDVEVSLVQNGQRKTWTIDAMSEDRVFSIDMNAKNLIAGKNAYSIDVTYYDQRGKAYTTSEQFEIELVNLSIGQQVLAFLNRLASLLNFGNN